MLYFCCGQGPYLGACNIPGDQSSKAAKIERQETSQDNDDSFYQSLQCIGSTNAFDE